MPKPRPSRREFLRRSAGLIATAAAGPAAIPAAAQARPSTGWQLIIDDDFTRHTLDGAGSRWLEQNPIVGSWTDLIGADGNLLWSSIELPWAAAGPEAVRPAVTEPTADRE